MPFPRFVGYAVVDRLAALEAENNRMKWLLKTITDDLPLNRRNWLDRRLEDEAREFGKQWTPEQLNIDTPPENP